ncbi:hypothetical protein DFS34DRAFT_256331 [Phlyctochytrium arcticum]|nr:hypothetical protein DFS34DRAFT_256331 [Phlyctochytrium arcticum]
MSDLSVAAAAAAESYPECVSFPLPLPTPTTTTKATAARPPRPPPTSDLPRTSLKSTESYASVPIVAAAPTTTTTRTDTDRAVPVSGPTYAKIKGTWLSHNLTSSFSDFKDSLAKSGWYKNDNILAQNTIRSSSSFHDDDDDNGDIRDVDIRGLPPNTTTNIMPDVDDARGLPVTQNLRLGLSPIYRPTTSPWTSAIPTPEASRAATVRRQNIVSPPSTLKEAIETTAQNLKRERQAALSRKYAMARELRQEQKSRAKQESLVPSFYLAENNVSLDDLPDFGTGKPNITDNFFVQTPMAEHHGYLDDLPDLGVGIPEMDDDFFGLPTQKAASAAESNLATSLATLEITGSTETVVEKHSESPSGANNIEPTIIPTTPVGTSSLTRGQQTDSVVEPTKSPSVDFATPDKNAKDTSGPLISLTESKAATLTPAPPKKKLDDLEIIDAALTGGTSVLAVLEAAYDPAIGSCPPYVSDSEFSRKSGPSSDEEEVEDFAQSTATATNNFTRQFKDFAQSIATPTTTYRDSETNHTRQSANLSRREHSLQSRISTERSTVSPSEMREFSRRLPADHSLHHTLTQLATLDIRFKCRNRFQTLEDCKIFHLAGNSDLFSEVKEDMGEGDPLSFDLRVPKKSLLGTPLWGEITRTAKAPGRGGRRLSCDCVQLDKPCSLPGHGYVALLVLPGDSDQDYGNGRTGNGTNPTPASDSDDSMSQPSLTPSLLPSESLLGSHSSQFICQGQWALNEDENRLVNSWLILGNANPAMETLVGDVLRRDLRMTSTTMDQTNEFGMRALGKEGMVVIMAMGEESDD